VCIVAWDGRDRVNPSQKGVLRNELDQFPNDRPTDGPQLGATAWLLDIALAKSYELRKVRVASKRVINNLLEPVKRNREVDRPPGMDCDGTM
jgi:hypothetical protein